MIDKTNTFLYKLIEADETPVLEVDQIIEGNVISIQGTQVFVELKPYGTGIIYGKEYLTARDLIRDINAGDTIKAKVVELKNGKRL